MPTGPCWWKFKNERTWRFGYCTYVGDGLWRMGAYNGDTTGGFVVEARDIDRKDYTGHLYG